jgi:hypothetical protein
MYWPTLHVAFTLVELFGMGNVNTTFSIGLPSVDLGCTEISNLPKDGIMSIALWYDATIWYLTSVTSWYNLGLYL